MVKIIEDSKVRKIAEFYERMYGLAEETFGREVCGRGFAGNIHIHAEEVPGFSVFVNPTLAIVLYRGEQDYAKALVFAERASEISEREFTLRRFASTNSSS